ncbi:MAG: autorepressor SdpR family transcription factor [Oscillospiraceae bacterium]|jgi:DNA-binding transcriptional ArsR family regulator
MGNTFKALSDETRRGILSLLRAGPMTAGEISSQFGKTDATVSHHLSVLRDAGLISDRKEGKFIYYELNMSVLDEIIKWVAALTHNPQKGSEQDEEEA